MKPGPSVQQYLKCTNSGIAFLVSSLAIAFALCSINYFNTAVEFNKLRFIAFVCLEIFSLTCWLEESFFFFFSGLPNILMTHILTR